MDEGDGSLRPFLPNLRGLYRSAINKLGQGGPAQTC